MLLLIALPILAENSYETRVLAALDAGDKKKLTALEAEFRKMKPEQRQKMNARVRRNSVEFRIRGVYPGDMCFPSGMEYLVAPTGERDHEVFVAVGKKELARALAIGKVLTKLKEAKKPAVVGYRFLWQNGNDLHSESIREMIDKDAKEKQRFFKWLTFEKHGWGSFNINVDGTLLPKKRVPSMLQVIVPRK